MSWNTKHPSNGVEGLRGFSELLRALPPHAMDSSVQIVPMSVSTLATEILRTGFMSQDQRSQLHQLLETGKFTPQEMRIVRRLINTIITGRVEIEAIG